MSGDKILSPAEAANAEFDQWSIRFAKQIANVDERTAQVLAAHFAVEQELDLCLQHFLPRPDRLGAFKFGHKIDILRSCCPDRYVDVFLDPAIRLDNLRNALAHNDSKQVAGCFRALVKSFTDINETGVNDTVAGIVTATRILTSGLTFIRVENFSSKEVGNIIGAHIMNRRHLDSSNES
jgi:hypothetical protein